MTDTRFQGFLNRVRADYAEYGKDGASPNFALITKDFQEARGTLAQDEALSTD